MSDTFEFAAAIAGVCIGLGAALLLSITAVVGSWRMFGQASKASEAASRAALSVEELARRIASPQPFAAENGPMSDVRRQSERLSEQQEALRVQQEQLHQMLRTLLDETAPAPTTSLDEIELSISRLDGTVAQMASALTSLIQLLERQQRQT
ncbi:MAG: hypothetical protein WEB04_02175 [Dehalococcoidia bacterium]